MSLSIDDHAQSLRMLLFIRQAWDLAGGMPLPRLHPAPETGNTAPPDGHDLSVWEERWLQAWSGAWGHQAQGRFRAPGTATILPAAGLRADSDFWTAQFGSEGIDMPAFERWEQMFEPSIGLDLDPVLRNPEVAPVLVAAWERGLTNLTVLPWAGYCMYRLSDTHLVTSFDTAASWSLLNQALAEWIRTPLA